MSAKHTPGPLKIAGRETRGLPHTLVAARTLLFRVYSEAYGDFDQETENARRLVACWNACEKVSTEDLEAITRPGDVSWAVTIDRLVRERDELRAAIEKIACSAHDLQFDAYEHARAVYANFAGSGL